MSRSGTQCCPRNGPEFSSRLRAGIPGRRGLLYPSEGRCAKINIQEGETWDVQGVIQGSDLQVYTPALNFTPYRPQHAPPVQLLRRLHRHLPPCGRPWPCAGRGTAQGTGRRGGNAGARYGLWKQSFRTFFFNGHGARTRTPLPYFSVSSRSPGACWFHFFRGPSEQVRSFPPCITKLPLQQIIQNPEWSEFFAPIAAGCKANRPASGLLRAQGGNSRRPDLVVFLGPCARNITLLWKKRTSPAASKARLFFPEAQPNLDDCGFSFDVMLKREGVPAANRTGCRACRGSPNHIPRANAALGLLSAQFLPGADRGFTPRLSTT